MKAFRGLSHNFLTCKSLSGVPAGTLYHMEAVYYLFIGELPCRTQELSLCNRQYPRRGCSRVCNLGSDRSGCGSSLSDWAFPRALCGVIGLL